MPVTRRRGGALEEAIFEAVFEQLEQVGYAKLTMEGVAASAQTGKAALYRRWPSRDQLVRDALLHVLPDPSALPRHDTVRADLIELLTGFRKVIVVTSGTALQVLKSTAPDLDGGMLHETIKNRVIKPIKDLILEALERGVRRGEVRPEAATPRIAQIGPAMLHYRCLTEGTQIPDELLLEIVDEILMPVLEVRPAPPVREAGT